MTRTLRYALMSATALAVSGGPALADYSLNILHMNDWHSRIESINKYDSTCSADDETEGACFGGAARLVTAVRETRAKLGDENVVLLNAGDNFQGSLFYTTYKGAVEAEFLNMIGTDAMAVGNHEFDDGPDGLATFLEKAEFPVLSANVAAGASSSLANKVEASTILEIGGEKIGIVGAVANDTGELSSTGDEVLIADDVLTITAAVKALARQGVSKIIALTHVGYPRDLAAIAKIPGVDVVVGGHTNTFLSNTSDKADGPYPTWVDNPLGYKVPVVQAYAYSKYLGDLKVTFSDVGIVKEATGEPILLDASFKPDEASVERIKELGAPIEELKNKVVSTTEAPIDGDRSSCRAMECEMGDLVADAMLDRVADQGISIAIQNGGGLRASIDAGEITMGEVLTVLPFQNTLATFQLKGSDVVAALENGLSQIEDGAGRYPQVAGLKFTYDKSKPAGERVVSVEVKEGDSFVPIEDDKVYGVASNNFMRAGGDGYSVFASNGMNAYDYGPGVEQVVADYLAENQPYKPYTDGRITEVTMAAPAEEKPMEETMEKSEAPAEETAKPAEEMAKPAEEMAKPAEETAVTTPELPKASMELTTAAPTIEAEPKPEPMASEETMKSEEPAETEAAMEPEATETEETMEKPMEATETEEAMETEETMKSEEAMAKPEETMEKPEAEMMGKTHTVVAGDSFWKLAKSYYGDATEWKRIAEANPEAAERGLEVGSSLTIPEM